MKLLIRNLARHTSEARIRDMFETYGRVQSCHLVLDRDSGGSKGFAFVEMPKVGEARAAVKHLNGCDLDGSRIRVKRAEAVPATESPRGR